jgi:hypothetical protein
VKTLRERGGRKSRVYNNGCFYNFGGSSGETDIMNTPHNTNKHRNFRFFVGVGFALALAGSSLAQSAPERTLIVNGKTVDAGLREIDGHAYIDVETLAKLTNGTVVIGPTRVVLKIPAAKSAAATTASAAPVGAEPVAAAAPEVNTAAAAVTPIDVPSTAAAASAAAAEPAAPAAATAPVAAAPVQPPPGLSRPFASAAIAELADMREWRGAIAAMITHGLAISDGWAQGYNDQVQAGLAKAEVAARTDDDREALDLLRNEAGKLASWWNTVLGERQALNGATTIDPDALKNDPFLPSIRNCGQFLTSMIVSGTFSDDGSCH